MAPYWPFQSVHVCHIARRCFFVFLRLFELFVIFDKNVLALAIVVFYGVFVITGGQKGSYIVTIQIYPHHCCFMN